MLVKYRSTPFISVTFMKDIYSFGPFRLDTGSLQLCRDGVNLKLRRKAVEVLRVLVERSHQWVLYSELAELAWGRPDLDPHLIHVTTAAVKKGLAECAHYVENAPGRGFRFR